MVPTTVVVAVAIWYFWPSSIDTPPTQAPDKLTEAQLLHQNQAQRKAKEDKAWLERLVVLYPPSPDEPVVAAQLFPEEQTNFRAEQDAQIDKAGIGRYVALAELTDYYDKLGK